jgi:hypothetical protein
MTKFKTRAQHYQITSDGNIHVMLDKYAKLSPATLTPDEVRAEIAELQLAIDLLESTLEDDDGTD